jgi:hypothetical protein
MAPNLGAISYPGAWRAITSFVVATHKGGSRGKEQEEAGKEENSGEVRTAWRD